MVNHGHYSVHLCALWLNKKKRFMQAKHVQCLDVQRCMYNRVKEVLRNSVAYMKFYFLLGRVCWLMNS